MVFDEFIEKIKERFEDTDFEWWGGTRDTIHIDWTIGGYAGGSCWGDKPYPREVEKEPEFEALDMVLELFCPNITLFQYKKLIKELVHYSKSYCPDYYGNNLEEAHKTVGLKELYDYIVNKGWVSGH
jgi:hypothetical protein